MKSLRAVATPSHTLGHQAVEREERVEGFWLRTDVVRALCTSSNESYPFFSSLENGRLPAAANVVHSV